MTPDFIVTVGKDLLKNHVSRLKLYQSGFISVCEDLIDIITKVGSYPDIYLHTSHI